MKKLYTVAVKGLMYNNKYFNKLIKKKMGRLIWLNFLFWKITRDQFFPLFSFIYVKKFSTLVGYLNKSIYLESAHIFLQRQLHVFFFCFFFSLQLEPLFYYSWYHRLQGNKTINLIKTTLPSWSHYCHWLAMIMRSDCC